VQVTVSRKGRLAEGVEASDQPVTLGDGAVTTDLLTVCGIDPRACVVVVNGVAVPHGTALADGDRAQLYPAQAGG
jgi:sulfur carrier protein ThiS